MGRVAMTIPDAKITRAAIALRSRLCPDKHHLHASVSRVLLLRILQKSRGEAVGGCRSRWSRACRARLQKRMTPPARSASFFSAEPHLSQVLLSNPFFRHFIFKPPNFVRKEGGNYAKV